MWMRDVPLDRRTRWRIGGPAPRFAEAADEKQMRALLEELEGADVLLLGGGANLLVSDEGPATPVLTLIGEFKRFEVDSGSIRFGGGTSIAAVVQAARREGRSGLWILEAVPGTMGGALRMNAGTTDEWLWDRVLWAEVMYPEGNVERLSAAEVKGSYRSIDLAERAIFIRAEVAAPPGKRSEVEREHMERRIAKLSAQVYDQPTCGSTWKNPSADSAWSLIDRVGLRGARRGGAQISPKHANFIVNLGEARANDVVELMRETRRRVHEEAGIWLEPELHFWGFSPDVLLELGVAA